MNLRREWPVFALLAILGAIWLAIAYLGPTKFKPNYKNYSQQKVEVNILHPPPPPPR